jgi:topoisomerase-4 subunit A
MQEQLDFEGVERVPLRTFTEKAYLDYSMYVILDRALPQVADGLKPVQRRIVYAMSELGLAASAKHKKSARTIGRRHRQIPSARRRACYEALVLMAQRSLSRIRSSTARATSARRTIPKSFAAMRYTEARLTPYAASLLAELAQGTVDWTPNFDGTLEEPRCCRASAERAPERRDGIAVGMATDIPAAQPARGRQACVLLLEIAGSDARRALRQVRGPDFPTGGEIVSSAEEIGASTRPEAAACACADATSARATTSSSPRCRIRCRANGCRSRSPSSFRRRSCPWSRTCATNPITRIRSAS